MDARNVRSPRPAVDLTICSDPSCLRVVRGAVEKMAGLQGFAEADVAAIVLAVDEALSNVIKHAYHGAADGEICIRLEPVATADRAGIQVTVRDFGQGADPAAIHGRDLDEVRPGGLGVHIIRTVMDEVQYSRSEDGGMKLRMVKYIRRAGTE